MQYSEECWASCGEEFIVDVNASRNSDELTAGIPVACTNCGEKYTFTVDGDGEPSLDSPKPEHLGENISGHRSDESTHY